MSEYLSPQGLEKLKKELEDLKTVKRREIASRLEVAKALGDLSENAEYQEAKEAQSLNESQIAELEEMLRNAVLIKKPTDLNMVQVGATIDIESDFGRETFTIVGSEEADPPQGKISNESPLGKAFLGKKVGDAAEVKTPGGMVKYKVTKIS
ncbi:MAG: transcription elongation factor GreA [bacterium]|nr:transcription elongation factor GreA [bacterium]